MSAPVGEVAPPERPDLQDSADRIDALIEAVAGGGPVASARTRERAEELVRVVIDLYGAGLERLLEIAFEAGRLDDELLDRLAADELVAGLLLVHGLHPLDTRTRVEQALADVQPMLEGSEVELLEVGDVARLRVTGTGSGCGSTAGAVEQAVRERVEAAAPELVDVLVEVVGADSAPLIPVDSLRVRLGRP